MNTKTALALTSIIFVLGATQVQAAGFLKYGDIKGESHAASSDDKHKDWIELQSLSYGKRQARSAGSARADSNQPRGNTRSLTRPQQPQPISLLVPAVQKVRMAPQPAPRKGRVGSNWKVEEGES